MKKLLQTFLTIVLICGPLSAKDEWTTFPIKKMIDTSNMPKSFRSEMQLRWDADSIYLNLFVKDTIRYISPENRYTGDNIEVYFDMENLKTPTMPRGTTPWPPLYRGNVGTYQFRLIPDTAFYSNCFAEDDNMRVKGIRQVYTKVDSGYKYSLAFPLDSLMPGHTYKEGDTIGFDVLISNNNGGVKPYRSQITWNAPNTRMWSDVCQWGTLILKDKGTFTSVKDTIRPTKPVNLKAEISGKDVIFTWDPSIDNTVVEIYYIIRDTLINGSKAMMGYGLYASENNSFTVSNLKTDTTYIFKLLALDVYYNMSEFSDSIIVKIPKVEINNKPQETSNLFSNLETFSLFPNPASDFINIKNAEAISTIEISNLSGQIVKKYRIQATTAQLNISSLKEGTYILKAYTLKGIVSRQFIK